MVVDKGGFKCHKNDNIWITLVGNLDRETNSQAIVECLNVGLP